MSAADGAVPRVECDEARERLLVVASATRRVTRPWTADEVAFLRKHYLRRRSAWCAKRLGPHDVAASPDPRPYDLPWVVLDHSVAATRHGFITGVPALSFKPRAQPWKSTR